MEKNKYIGQTTNAKKENYSNLHIFNNYVLYIYHVCLCVRARERE